MIEITIGQRWIHKLTSMSFQVELVEGDEVILMPEENSDGQELTLSKKLLQQEFRCPAARRAQLSEKNRRRIKPGKIRRGVRR